MYRKLIFLVLACIALIPLANASGISVSITPDEEYVTPTFSSVSDQSLALYTIAVKNYYNYTQSVKVYAYSSPQVTLNWSQKVVNVDAYGVATLSLVAYSSQEGDYEISVVASTPNDMASTSCKLVVQDFDYASETAISGVGNFVLEKKVFDMDAAVNAKSIAVMNGGMVEGFVKNDYLIRHSKDKIPNFKKTSKVSAYYGNSSLLAEQENFIHSFAFGGTGARISEEYEFNSTDGRLENIVAHTDSIADAKTEFTTFDDFSGHFKLDAKQSLPGKGSYEEFNELFGKYQFYRHIVFKKD